MLTEAELLQKNIGHTTHEAKLFFDIEEIRDVFPHTKFPSDKTMSLSIGSYMRDTIFVDDIQEMTDFDKKILQAINFNTQKK